MERPNTPLGTHRPITLSLVTGIQLLKETRCFELRNNICIGEASCILSLFIISPQKFIEIKVFHSVRALETKEEKQRIGPFLFLLVFMSKIPQY